MEFEIERIIRDLTPDEIERAKNGDKSITYTQLGLSINGRTYMYDTPVKCCDPVALFKKKSEGYVFKNKEYDLIYSEMTKAIEKAEYSNYSIYFSDADSIKKQIVDGRVTFKDIKYSELMNNTNLNDITVVPPISSPSKREELEEKVSNFKISERAIKWIARGIAAIALLGGGHHLVKYISNNSNSNINNEIDINNLNINSVRSSMLNTTSKFVEKFNTLADLKVNDDDFRLKITADEARAYWLFANSDNLNSEQIAKIFGEESYIINPTESANLLANFMKQIHQYELLTGTSFNMSSFLINDSDQNNYKEFSDQMEKAIKENNAKEVNKLWNDYLISGEGSLQQNRNVLMSSYNLYLNSIKLLSKDMEKTINDKYSCAVVAITDEIRGSQFYLAKENSGKLLPQSNKLTAEEEELRNKDKIYSKAYVDPTKSNLNGKKEMAGTTVTEQTHKTESWTTNNSVPSNALEQQAYNNAGIDNKNKVEQNKADIIAEKHNDAVKDVIDDGVNKDGLYDIPNNIPETAKDVIADANEQLKKDPAKTWIETGEEKVLTQAELEALMNSTKTTTEAYNNIVNSTNEVDMNMLQASADIASALEASIAEDSSEQVRTR